MSLTSCTRAAVAKIPVVDFSEADCWKPGSCLSLRKDVCHALEEFGRFVMVLPNKFTPELQDRIFGILQESFDFAIEIKAQVPQEQPVCCFTQVATLAMKAWKLLQARRKSGSSHIFFGLTELLTSVQFDQIQL